MWQRLRIEITAPFAGAQLLEAFVQRKTHNAEIIASFLLNIVPASHALLSSPTMRCLWYKHPSGFAAECGPNSLCFLFVLKLHCLGRHRFICLCSSILVTSTAAELFQHHSFENMYVLAFCFSALTHTEKKLLRQTSSIQISFKKRYFPAFSCSYKFPNWLMHILSYQNPFIFTHGAQLSPKASRGSTKSKEAF